MKLIKAALLSAIVIYCGPRVADCGIRIEAESMALINYVIEQRPAASGALDIRLAGPEGTAAATFTGRSGSYKVVVGYLDEIDGKSRMNVMINGTRFKSHRFDLDNGQLETTVIWNSAYMTHGAVVTLHGVRDGGELARLDYIEFLPANPENVRFEAEDMILNGYVIENRSSSSGGKNVKTPQSRASAVKVISITPGTYRIEVGYIDEHDGQSRATVKIDEKTVRTWKFDESPGTPPSTVHRTRVISSGRFLPGRFDLALIGEKNAGELARIDYIEFQPKPQTTWRKEAEEMGLTNYQIESHHAASGGKRIKATRRGASARTRFTGANGTYDIVVGYFDEHDGQSPAAVVVEGNELDSWSFEQNSNEYKTHKVASNLFLKTGDTIILKGDKQAGELARFDYVELQPVVPSWAGFPIEGFGAGTTGGAGGKVIWVKNLNDSGTGSLREALEAPFERIVVFDVSGLITLDSPIVVRVGNLTIDASTAPGPVTLRGAADAWNLNDGAILFIQANNVILRHLRVRAGSTNLPTGSERDALQIVNADRVVVDHCSLSWSTDEVLSILAATNVTILG